MSSSLQESLVTLFRELIDGPDADAAWMLNGGDIGLLRSLDNLTASAASAAPPASIASHVDHLRYGLSLMNRWSRGEPNPWATADWTTSWTRSTVDDQEWAEAKRALAVEARAWLETLGVARDYSSFELNGVIASVAHLAYHLGAIRQIDRTTRGPLAG
jgi:hypothetical protein